MGIDRSLKPSTGIPRPSYHHDNLHWFGVDLQHMAERYGTPLQVGSAGAVHDTIRQFTEPFNRARLPLSIYYSVKTNPVPVFLDELRHAGCGFEIVNAHETTLLKRLGIDQSPIIQTGVSSFHNDSLPNNLRMVTVSNLFQLQELADRHSGNHLRIPVAITIRPGLWRGYWDITLNTSRKGSPMGIDPTSKEFAGMLTFIASHPALELLGLHMHLGSGIHSDVPYQKGIKMLEQAAIKAHKDGLNIRILNIGGGFGLSTAPMMKVRSIVSSLLGFTPGEYLEPQTFSLLDSIAQQLARSVKRLGKEGIYIEEIVAEPGRILSGPCQLMLLMIREVVRSQSGPASLVCDGGAMSLSPMLLTERHQVMALKKRLGPPTSFEILGPLPSALDRVAVSSTLSPLRPGDHLAVLDTGAYFYSMSNTFNGPRPGYVWIKQGKAEWARRSETVDDLLSLDLLPENLHPTVERHA